ncbi:hypothetical protein JOB18_048887 [Solea senegalensis]|uniref:Uncharacterized protein n=1 Tax=Solea senegalensis TaxID=28829 RepID=A0AAV6PLQ3_SOLSE|nr:hypothetical protein JOB18_011199 [Solea senegalensis]KAG7468840.1 hypothetical protein JOB18_048887 [Solea senegalensis]
MFACLFCRVTRTSHVCHTVAVSPFELRSTRTDCFLSCDHWTEHRSTSDVLQET